jgi:hypothetical protein
MEVIRRAYITAMPGGGSHKNGAVRVKCGNFHGTTLSGLLLRYFMTIREVTMGTADFQV